MILHTSDTPSTSQHDNLRLSNAERPYHSTPTTERHHHVRKDAESSTVSPTTASKASMTVEELDKLANECTVAAYNLVWHQRNYEQALSVLHEALKIQRSYLGKHHRDVGYTCNFIATAYWLEGRDLNGAMRYFLEARRIFCKSLSHLSKEEYRTADGSDPSCPVSPLLANIDGRIHCILVKFGLPEHEIQRAKEAIERTMAHELHGDYLKSQGLVQQAKEEYRCARKIAGILRQLI